MPGTVDPSGAASAAGGARIDQAVLDYIDAIPAGHRALFDRLHQLILRVKPDVTVVLAYKMPTYKAGRRRVYLGAWQHGVSLYGWQQDQDDGFVARHRDLKTSTGTIRLRPADAAVISDEEFSGLLRAALGA